MTTPRRIPALPDVPTVAEAGIPDMPVDAWCALFLPAGVPKPIVERMHAEVLRILRDPQIRDRLAGQGMNIVASTPDEFSRFLDPQMARWAAVVKEYGIRAGD